MGIRRRMFRGYNLKNKKWLYGYYLVNRGKHFIAEEGLQQPGMTWEDFEVDPESVGQFIGEYKGKPIYEGDILEVVARSSIGNNLMAKKRGVVTYSGYNNSYRVKNEGFHKPIIFYDKIENLEPSSLLYYTYEILGNKYEEKLKRSNP